MVNDPKLIKATKDAVRVLIRRPHAYKFRRDHPKAAIPSLAVLNAEGRLLGGSALPSGKAVSTIIELLKKHRKKRAVVR